MLKTLLLYCFGMVIFFVVLMHFTEEETDTYIKELETQNCSNCALRGTPKCGKYAAEECVSCDSLEQGICVHTQSPYLDECVEDDNKCQYFRNKYESEYNLVAWCSLWTPLEKQYGIDDEYLKENYKGKELL